MDKISSAGAGANVPQKTSYLKKLQGSVAGTVQTTLDAFIPGDKGRSVDINTNIPGYQEIKTEDAAKMLGYFTQKMEAQGFPWALYKPRDGLIRKKEHIGESNPELFGLEGEALLKQAKIEADKIKSGANEYAESVLNNLMITLTKAETAVNNGKERLQNIKEVNNET